MDEEQILELLKKKLTLEIVRERGCDFDSLQLRLDGKRISSVGLHYRSIRDKY